MKKKIYFVLGSTDGQRCFKRIGEYKRAGYEVKVFGFERGLNVPIAGKEDCEIIASFSNDLPYIKRIRIIYSSLKRLYDSYKSEKEVVWYYFGELIALFSYKLNSNRRFIYEESDLSTMKYAFLTKIKRKLQNHIIKRSLLTVYTSEGFLSYHFGLKSPYPENTLIKPNKVNPLITSLPPVSKTKEIGGIRFGFVGCIRFHSVYQLASYIAHKHPEHECHFFGVYDNVYQQEKYATLSKYSNIHFHGAFKNPYELPTIYAQIDVLIATYDTNRIGIRYAEPNKLYEAIYFRKPIIVSPGTFLCEKVEKLGIGYVIDASDVDDMAKKLAYIKETYKEKTATICQIPKETAVDDASELIKRTDILFVK